jgi:cytochrome bd-type quinol oxidase subunit 2
LIVPIMLGVIDSVALGVGMLSQHLAAPDCKTNRMLDQVNPMTAPLA